MNVQLKYLIFTTFYFQLNYIRYYYGELYPTINKIIHIDDDCLVYGKYYVYIYIYMCVCVCVYIYINIYTDASKLTMITFKSFGEG